MRPAQVRVRAGESGAHVKVRVAKVAALDLYLDFGPAAVQVKEVLWEGVEPEESYSQVHSIAHSDLHEHVSKF